MMRSSPFSRFLLGCFVVFTTSFLLSHASAAPPAIEPTFTTTPSERSCKTDNDCSSSCINGKCGSSGITCTTNSQCGTTPFCNPKTNRCTACLDDDNCTNSRCATELFTQSCNVGATSCSSSTRNFCSTVDYTCPSSCSSDSQCLAGTCGRRVKCLGGKCTVPPAALACQPPNLVIILDESCSMANTGSSLVDSGLPCTDRSQCLSKPEMPHLKYTSTSQITCPTTTTSQCTIDGKGDQVCTNVRTCRYTRWDIAVNALVKAIDTYGGTAANQYLDQKVRFGLVYFGQSSRDHTNISGTSTYHGIVKNNGDLILPTVHRQSLILSNAPGSSTNYDAGFTLARNMLDYARTRDSVGNRKSAVLFVTDGDVNSGRTTNTQKGLYKHTRCDFAEQQAEDIFTDFFGTKSYIVGFGNGLSAGGQQCLNDLARAGQTKPASCATGECLFFQANNAASLQNALAEIIANAAAEECDGIDNNCDGRVDENLPGCVCQKSYTKNVSTSYINQDTTVPSGSNNVNNQVRMYNFLSTFNESGNCQEAATGQKRLDVIYNEICRNEKIQALSCTNPSNADPQPAGNAWGIYCQQCCFFGGNACSWPLYHACNNGQRPFGGADGTATCFNNCKDWCKNNKRPAADCMMPRGKLERIGMKQSLIDDMLEPIDSPAEPKPPAYPGSPGADITVDFGRILDAHVEAGFNRNIFVNQSYQGTGYYFNTLPTYTPIDHRAPGNIPSMSPTNLGDYCQGKPPEFNDNRPLIADLNPASLSAITHSTPGNTPATPIPSSYQFTSTNTAIRSSMRLECGTAQCAPTCVGALCCSPAECSAGCTTGADSTSTAGTGKGKSTSTADCLEEYREIIGMVLGYRDTNRKYRTYKLGAIYHSTPSILTRPLANLDDPYYLAWRKTPIGGTTFTIGEHRPSVVFVGSNDGLMHAFHADSGMELWAYMPKSIIANLKNSVRGQLPGGGRAYTVDGSPVSGNYQMFRYFDDGACGSGGRVVAKYRSVVLFGMGLGGRGYTAIDVTNPFKPRLMWEISDYDLKDPADTTKGRFDRLGYTTARPMITTALVRWNRSLNQPDPNANAMERSIAILPGGSSIHVRNIPPTYRLNKNDNHVGAVVYILDLETGRFLSEIVPFDETPKNACATGSFGTICSDGYRPVQFYDARAVTGTPVAFPVSPAPSNRIFFGDVLGRVFRIDISNPDSSRWSNVDIQTGQRINNSIQREYTKLMHDPFKYTPYTQPIMASFSIALNPRGEAVITGATGDVTNVESYEPTGRSFSLREVLNDTGTFKFAVHAYHFPFNTFNETGPLGQMGAQKISPSYTGEKATGDPLILSGVSYFTTFHVSHETPPICGLPGEAKLYGIRYDEGCTSGTCKALADAGRIDAGSRTPYNCCQPGGCNPTDPNARWNDNEMGTPFEGATSMKCKDLNHTQPMLMSDINITQPNNYQYFRYHGFGPNTLSMGPTVSYSPGTVENVPRDPTDPSKGSSAEVKQRGRLAVQVSLSRRTGGGVFNTPPNSVVRTTGPQNSTTPVMMGAPQGRRVTITSDWTLVLDS